MVTSEEKVADELLVPDDYLATWVEERHDTFFLRPDSGIANAFAVVSDWATRSGYAPSAVSSTVPF